MTRAGPKKSRNLHGSAPDQNDRAMLIIDMISDFKFPDGMRLLRRARPAARAIARLKARARAVGIPVIYVNDNRGRWRSDHKQMVHECLRDEVPSRDLIEMLAPRPDDYFIFKPKHSGFYATPLSELLVHLGVHTLILTGVTGQQCVLFTAIDAYVRDFNLIIPRDCVASVDARLTQHALFHFKRVLRANTAISARVRL
jgi:nicotinamidase-related amidase